MIHDADLILMSESRSDACQCVWIVVPDLHGQRARFVMDAPQSIRDAPPRLIEPDKALGVDHFGGQQARPAVLPDDLPKGIVRVTRHRRLQHRRIDGHGPNLQGRGAQRGQFPPAFAEVASVIDTEWFIEYPKRDRHLPRAIQCVVRS